MKNCVKLMFVVLSIACASVFAVPAFPNWKENDLQVWKKYIEDCDKENAFCCSGKFVAGILENNLTTFEAMKDWHEANKDYIYKNASGSSATAAAYSAYALFACAMWRYGLDSEICNDAIAYAKEVKSNFYIYMVWKDTSITENEKYDYAFNWLLNVPHCNFFAASNHLKTFLSNLTKVTYDDAKVLADLKKLNRKYSSFLNNENEKQRKIAENEVASIRTVISAY